MDQQELIEQLQLLRETLTEINQANTRTAQTINDLNKSIHGADGAFDDFENSIHEADTALRNAARQEREAAKDAKIAEQARAQAFDNSTKAAVTALTGFADTVFFSSQKGFSKFSGSLNSAGDAAFELGKSFGGLAGIVLGMLAKAVTTVVDLQLKQTDALLTHTDTISKTGAANAFTAEEVRHMGRNAGLASNEMDKLIKPMTSMGGALKVLGGSSTEAVARFASMNDVTRETRESFQRLGLDDEQRIQATADYVQLMFKSGTALSAQQKTQESLIKQTKAYTENLFVLADLTGTDIETAQKNLEVTSSTIEVALANNKFASERGQLEQRLKDEAQTLSDQEKERINERIAQIDAEKKGLDDLNQALSGMNLAPAEKAAFQLEYLTGAVTSTAGGLLASGINISDLNEQLRNGTISVGEFQDAVLTSKQAAYDQFGNAIALSKEFQDTLNITAEGVAQVTQETQNRLEGNSRAQAEEAARARIAANEAGEGAAANDPAQVARNFMTETERAARLFADNLVAETNPLLQGLNGLTIATTALTAAVGVAVVALGAYTLKRGAGSILGSLGGGRGGGGADIPNIPESTSKAVGSLGTGLRGAGKGAAQIALGGAAIGAAIAAIGAGIAGAAWLTGKAFPTFVEGLQSFEELNGSKLVDAAKGMTAIGAAIAVMGTGTFVGGILGGIGSLFIDEESGGTPIDKLKEFQEYDLDAPKITKNAEAITAYSNAMSAMGNIGGGLSSIVEAAADGILGLFGKGRAEIPWDKIQAFGEITLPTEKIEANSEAVTAYAIAMAKLTTVNGLESFGSMAAGIFDGIGNWARGAATLPWDKMIEFGEITLPTEKIEANSEAVTAYAIAMAKLTTANVGESFGSMASAIFDSIGNWARGAVALPWDDMMTFAGITLPDTLESNIERLGEFGEAIAKVPEIPTRREGGLFGTIATFFSGDVQMPWDALEDFSTVSFTKDQSDNIVRNAESLGAFGEAVSKVPDMPTSTTSGGKFDAIASYFSGDVQMPWDTLKSFSEVTFTDEAGEKIVANANLLKVFGEALSTMPQEIKGIEIDSGLFSDDVMMPWDLMKTFESKTFEEDKIKANSEILKTFGESLSAVPEIKPISADENDVMPWDLIKLLIDSGIAENSQNIDSSVQTIVSVYDKLKDIPEIKITFTEESKTNFDRLTSSLDDFSKLHSEDILKNLEALHKFDTMPSIVRSPEAQVKVTTNDQIVSSITNNEQVPITNNTPTITKQTSEANSTTPNINEQLIMMLSQKLDIVIDLLGTGVTIQDRILLESRS